MLSGGKVLLLGLSLAMPTPLLAGKASADLRLRCGLSLVALSALCSEARRDMAVMRVSEGVLPLLCTHTQQKRQNRYVIC